MEDLHLTEISFRALQSHEYMLSVHSKAIACHCECLGMNAENSNAVCEGRRPPYADVHYMTVMQKWGLIDKDCKPII